MQKSSHLFISAAQPTIVLPPSCGVSLLSAAPLTVPVASPSSSTVHRIPLVALFTNSQEQEQKEASIREEVQAAARVRKDAAAAHKVAIEAAEAAATAKNAKGAASSNSNNKMVSAAQCGPADCSND